MKGKTVLVTGGAGKMGSHLCEELLREGNYVICIDNLSTGSKENIFHLMDDPRFEFIRKDITEPYAVEVNEIFHLAYPDSCDYRRTHPIEVTRTAFMGTLNTLEVAKRTKCTFHYPEVKPISCEEIRKDQRKEQYYTDQQMMKHVIDSYVEKFGVRAVAIKLKKDDIK